MIKNIHSSLPPGYAKSVNNVEGQPGAVPNQETRQLNTGNSAEVSLSDDARALQRILQAAQEAPDVRTDIVETIKGQLEAGNYNVNANDLASKLLPFMK